MKHGQIAVGGNYNAEERFIEPTIIVDVKPEDPLCNKKYLDPSYPS
ncbi:hypothetical protein DOY81_013834 [Sarcophaga bullata]|nr:hypothetical protein DOY81_013834 [Sarcophaga bullata]